MSNHNRLRREASPWFGLARGRRPWLLSFDQWGPGSPLICDHRLCRQQLAAAPDRSIPDPLRNAAKKDQLWSLMAKRPRRICSCRSAELGIFNSVGADVFAQGARFLRFNFAICLLFVFIVCASRAGACAAGGRCPLWDGRIRGYPWTGRVGLSLYNGPKTLPEETPKYSATFLRWG
jgi:hypothetical protein